MWKSAERAACQAAFFHENGNESDNRTRELFYLGNIIISWKSKKELDSCWTQQSGWILHGYRSTVMKKDLHDNVSFSLENRRVISKMAEFHKEPTTLYLWNNFPSYHKLFLAKYGR